MPDSFSTQRWARNADGDIILNLIEGWDAGVTEHGDIAMSFTATHGNDPEALAADNGRAQFLCTREDARQIAHMILRALAYSDAADTSGFTALQGRIQSPALRALADDWNTARGARRMPGWRDIRPEPTAPYLGGLWGYDYDQRSGAFTGRVAGSTIAVAYGRNYLGKPLSELYLPHVAEFVRSHLMRIVSEPACALYSGKLFRMGEQVVEGERLVLPLGDDGEHPDGVLGASHYAGFPLSHVPEPVEFISDIADWCRV